MLMAGGMVIHSLKREEGMYCRDCGGIGRADAHFTAAGESVGQVADEIATGCHVDSPGHHLGMHHSGN